MHVLTVGYWTTILDSTREMNVIRCGEYLLKGNISPEKWRMRKSQPGKDRDIIQLCKGREILAEETAARFGEEVLVLGGQWPALMVAPGSQSHVIPSPPSDICFTPYWVSLMCSCSSGSSPWLDPLMELMPHYHGNLEGEATARQKPQQQQRLRKHEVESMTESAASAHNRPSSMAR